MPVPHTTIAIKEFQLTSQIKINDLASEFLTSCIALNQLKYGDYQFSRYELLRVIFAHKAANLEVGAAGTADVLLDGSECHLTELDVPSELLLGWVLVFANRHPSVGLEVTSEAPPQFLHAALRLARACDPSITQPYWMDDLVGDTLDRESIPASMDFKG